MDKYLSVIGKVVIFLGVMIILAILLPAGAWWFIGGVSLVVIGVNCCRSCRKR